MQWKVDIKESGCRRQTVVIDGHAAQLPLIDDDWKGVDEDGEESELV